MSPVLTCLFVLQIFKFGTITGLRKCDDCLTYTSCREAHRLLHSLRNNQTAELLRKAFCGNDYSRRRTSISPKVCCSDFQNVMLLRHPNMDLLPKSCGEITRYHRIDGTVPMLYEFPWMALIAYKVDGSVMFRCTGSIINSFHILTAAHCVQNKRLAGVRVGDFDYSERFDCQVINIEYVCETHVQDILIEESIVHPSYTSHGSMANDIALIRLKKEIDFNHKNVAPICLPVTESLRNANLAGQLAIVASWGITKANRGSSTTLKVYSPVLSQRDCKFEYNRKLFGDKILFSTNTEKKLCSRGQDSCGDSGGPLIVEKEYNGVYSYVQYGIVSQSPQRCTPSGQSLYTDVTQYLSWILDNVTQ